MPPPYEVGPAFKRRLSKKPPEQVSGVMECMRRVAEEPPPPGLKSSRVEGVAGVWHARIDGANRLTYDYEGGKLRFRNNCDHDKVLRSP